MALGFLGLLAMFVVVVILLFVLPLAVTVLAPILLLAGALTLTLRFVKKTRT